MEKRLDYIDVAKGLAIILVVFGHASGQMIGTTFFEEHLRLQWEIIFSFVMPLFFIISGSFQRKRFKSPDFNHKAFVIKAVSSTLLPFYSLSLLFLLLNVLLDNLKVNPSYGYYLLLAIPGVTLPLLYGILISRNRMTHKVLLGRNP